jgi:tetratricopeptide (TPR) repeat protein
VRARRLILVLVVLIGAALAVSVGARALRPERGVTTRSREALRHYEDGLAAMQKFYDAEARMSWELALETDPEFAMAAARLARMSLAFGDLAGAHALYARAAAQLGEVSERERLYIELVGADLSEDAARKRAIKEEMLARFPDDPEILLLAGTHALDEGRSRDALPLLTRAVRLDPSFGEAHNLLGYTFAALGRWDEAAESFQKYVFIYPDQANPHDSLGEMYLRIGRYDDALDEFDRALELKPDFSWALHHRAVALTELGRHDAALAAIHRAIETAAGESDAALWSRSATLLLLRAERWDEALAHVEAHHARFPEDPLHYGLRARALLAGGHLSPGRAAADSLHRALLDRASLAGADSITALDSVNWVDVEGWLARAEGRWEAAAERFGRAASLSENWVVRRRIEFRQAEALVATGRADSALALLEPALARNPADPEALYWSALALQRLGRTTEAEVTAAKALRRLDGADPDDPLVTRLRALIVS